VASSLILGTTILGSYPSFGAGEGAITWVTLISSMLSFRRGLKTSRCFRVYFIDVGASQLIIDGKIKLKNDSRIERFIANGLRFENGSELAADVVVFATG